MDVNIRTINAAITAAAVCGVLLASRAVAAHLPTPLAIHWSGVGSAGRVNGTGTRASVALLTLGLILVSGVLGHATKRLWVGVLGTGLAVTSAAAIYFTNRGLALAAEAPPPTVAAGPEMALVLFLALVSVAAAVTVDLRISREHREG